HVVPRSSHAFTAGCIAATSFESPGAQSPAFARARGRTITNRWLQSAFGKSTAVRSARAWFEKRGGDALERQAGRGDTGNDNAKCSRWRRDLCDELVRGVAG